MASKCLQNKKWSIRREKGWGDIKSIFQERETSTETRKGIIFENYTCLFVCVCDRKVGSTGERKEGTMALRSAGPAICPGATIRDLFDPTVIWDGPVFCHYVFKFIHIKLSKSPILGDVDLLAASELELGPAEGLNHILLVLQLGADGHHLANVTEVDPGHCALGLSKGTVHIYPEPRLGTACVNVHWKGLSPRSLRATHTANRLHTLPRRLLLATTAHPAPTGKRAQSA